MNLFWIAASAAEIPADNPVWNKTLLANEVSILFINAKAAGINGQEKFKNSPFWQVIFLLVPFNKIPPFAKDLSWFLFIFQMFYREGNM